MGDDVTIVRIYLNESDHGRKKSLMEEILNILHDQHRVHGVVVFRAIAGFGSKGAAAETYEPPLRGGNVVALLKARNRP